MASGYAKAPQRGVGALDSDAKLRAFCHSLLGMLLDRF
jgi:hypothetical protein